MRKILERTYGQTFGCNNIDIIDPCSWNKLVDAIEKRNAFIPDISRTLFNIGTKKYNVRDENGKTVKDENGKPKTEVRKVLTTVIFFADGTKCTVTNSEHDGVKFEKNDDGIEVASACSKEVGVVYALVKKLTGCPDENGNILGDGFGRKLHDIVDTAYDINVEEAKRKAAKTAAKAKYEATKNTGKPKRQRESLAKSVDRLAGILGVLDSKLLK